MINSLASRLKNPNTPNRRGCRQCKLTYRGYSTHAVELLDVSHGIIIILCTSVYLATFNLWKILSILEVCSLAMDSQPRPQVLYRTGFFSFGLSSLNLEP